MTLVCDASAILALLRGEPGHPVVEALLGQGGGACAAVNLAEVVDVLVRKSGVDPTEVATAVEDLQAAGLRVEPCDSSLGMRAGQLRATHYQRQSLPISMADCVALATAERLDGTLVSSDSHLCHLAASLGVAVHPIANSSGVVPEV